MSNILALDVGEKRVGVAIASTIAKLPRPLTTVPYLDALEALSEIIEAENIEKIVVGLPLNRNNEPTEQTKFTEAFIEKLHVFSLETVTVDEALSSKRAKDELMARKKHYEKGEVDSLAATYILEDYLKEEALI